MEYQIIIFPSVHFTLAAEQVLKENDIEHQVVPVPPYINEGCGLGIKIGASLTEKVLNFLKIREVETEKVIELEASKQ